MADIVHFQKFLTIQSTFSEISNWNLQRMCNLMILTEWTWFHWKILILDHVIGQRWRACSYLCIRFFPITQPFFSQLGWYFCGSSGDYYLSIGHDKSRLWNLFYIFDILGHFWRENGRGHHAGPLWPGASNPTKKLSYWVGQLLSRKCVFKESSELPIFKFCEIDISAMLD